MFKENSSKGEKNNEKVYSIENMNKSSASYFIDRYTVIKNFQHGEG